ncbi:DegV family protein [Psychromicrobium lacuslunae]|uniref:DegV family protein n=1 Tax=Psychromicrobium lacuslunae TaxID=1618207 RepID=A0A0D4BX42_9MICC|nr:DegV family protein [Psychromicrobium lacuslunae]AJT41002.1 degV family protein [Psychromicrobium lacuslunae]
MTGSEGPLGWLRAKLRLPGDRQSAPSAVVEPRLAVVTDSAAALPAGFRSELLTVVPMPVMVDGEIFDEGDPELLSTLSLALAAGKPVKTSRPSPGHFERVYQGLADQGYQQILSVHISAELSGTVEAARLAAGRVEVPVHVLDSRTVAMAQGFAVQAAVRAAERGDDFEQVLAIVNQQLQSSKVFFYVPSLEQLRRGGRIGAAASWFGTVLAIKPILSVANGQVVPLERVRSSAKAIARMDELVAQEIIDRKAQKVQCQAAVHHFGNPDQAENLLDRVRAMPVPPELAFISDLPAVLAAHVGLGVLAVVITGVE